MLNPTDPDVEKRRSESLARRDGSVEENAYRPYTELTFHPFLQYRRDKIWFHSNVRIPYEIMLHGN